MRRRGSRVAANGYMSGVPPGCRVHICIYLFSSYSRSVRLTAGHIVSGSKH